jgi:endonuclease YncB( thermonuclease family)
MFALTGVIIEKPVKEDVPSKPDISVFEKTYPVVDKNGKPVFGNIILHYVRDNVFQRKVDISIKKLDSYGAFIGQLFIDGKDLGQQLLERGFAKIHAPSLRKLNIFSAYKNAYDNARERRIGLWEYHDFEEEDRKIKEAQAERDSQKNQKQSYPIAVTDVRSGVDFSFQILSDPEETQALEGLSASLQNENFSSERPHTPKLYETVAAQFTVDDLWYRAEIIGVPPKNEKDNHNFEVRYLDYGNRETITPSRIRQLPPEYVTLIKPQAKDGRLYCLRAPDLEKSEFGRDSMTALRDMLWDKVLYAECVKADVTNPPKNSDKKEPTTLHHLIVYEEKKDLNKNLVQHGHVKVDHDYAKSQDPYYGALVVLQEEAHDHRLGVWQWGADPDDDEEM